MSKFWPLEAWAKTVEIKVERPNGYTIDDIRFSAIESAHDQRDLYRERNHLDFDDGEEWAPADEDRAVVAFLRHNVTNYEELSRTPMSSR